MPSKTLAATLVAAAMAIAAPASTAQTSGGGGAAAPSPGAKKPAKAKESQTSTVKLPKVLRDIAQCESGGDPTAISPDGRYRGKFQFAFATWRAYGGEGDPAAAPEAEQDRRALKAYRAEGTAPWPNCA